MGIPTIKDMQSISKSRSMEIPISQVVDILYKPTGSCLHALVASSEFTDQPEGNLVYVEAGSQHNMLGLWDIPKEPATNLSPKVSAEGYYDRDPTTRKITAIYLQEEDVTPASYTGTLKDLLQNPNIVKR